MRVLGLDPARECGWAVWVGNRGDGVGRIVAAGTWVLGKKRDGASVHLAELAKRMKRALREEFWVAEFGEIETSEEGIFQQVQPVKITETPDLMVYESADHRAIQGAEYSIQRRSEMIGVALLMCERMGVPTLGLRPDRIKRLATGDGVCGKKRMLAAARGLWPEVEWEDHNHVDAALAAWCGAREWRMKNSE